MEHKKILSRIFKVVTPLVMVSTVVSDVPPQPPRPTSPHEWSLGRSPLEQLTEGKNPGDRKRIVAAFKKNCVAPARSEKFFHAGSPFYKMQHAGKLSRSVHDLALRDGILTCPTAQRGAARSYDAGYNVVYTASGATAGEVALEAVHGVVHAEMERTGTVAAHPREGLFSRVTRQLAAEAAAMTAEFVSAAEAADRGDASEASALAQRDSAGWTDFQAALERGRRQRDGTEASAIESAAAETFGRMMRDPAFISRFAETSLQAYFSQFMNYSTAAAPQPRHDFTKAELQGLASITGVALARGQVPLSRAEMARLSPATAEAITTIENLRAQKFGYVAPAPLVPNAPFSGVKLQDVVGQLKLSGGIYTMRQALGRAKFQNFRVYPNRRFVIEGALKNGFQIDYDRNQIPPGMEKLWAHTQQMSLKSPVIGRALSEYARIGNIFVCAGEMPGSILADWSSDKGIFRMRTDLKDGPIDVSIQAHELLHAIQDGNAIKPGFGMSNIWDRQMRLMSTEAASKAIESMIALEYALHGDAVPAQHIHDPTVYFVEHAVYARARAEGKDYKTALTAAGLAGWHEAFRMPYWRDAYNARVLEAQARYIISDQVRAAQAEDAASMLKAIRLSGQVTPAFSFTKGILSIPTPQERLGANTQMRHAFNYVIYTQQQRALGPSAAKTQQTLAQLRSDNNPYLKVDLRDALALYDAMAGSSNLLQIMNFKAGIGPAPAALPIKAANGQYAPPPSVSYCAPGR